MVPLVLRPGEWSIAPVARPPWTPTARPPVFWQSAQRPTHPMPRPTRPCDWFLRLSCDEWLYIADYVGSAVLSQVCQATWAVLQGRHLSWHANLHNVAQVMASLKGGRAIHCLAINCRDMKDDGVRALATLKDATRITRLTLNLQNNCIRGTGVQALRALKDAAALKVLSPHTRTQTGRPSPPPPLPL